MRRKDDDTTHYLRRRGKIAFLAGLPVVAHAEQGWIKQAHITKIVGTAQSGINVRITPSLQNCVSQSGYGPKYASLYPDHPGKQEILSILLAAYISEKVVAIYLSDSTCRIKEVELGGR